MRLKDSSAKWKVTLENRNNELVYSVTTNGLFPSSTFRIKLTKVPLLLQEGYTKPKPQHVDNKLYVVIGVDVLFFLMAYLVLT